MSQNPDAIRADIEQTRQRLGYDVDAVADKVSPSHIAHRQGEKFRGAVAGMKDRVMGTADDMASGTRHAASDAGAAVDRTEQRVVRKTQGNPLAAGLIAFGAGLLVSSLIPPSEKEREIAQTLKEKAEPVTHELADAASQAAQNLREPAREAVQSVKDTAAESAQTVKEEAQEQKAVVQERAQDAQHTVRDY
jgi:gas vesicle protein